MDREIAASEKTALEAVLEDLEKRRAALEAESEELAVSEEEGVSKIFSSEACE